MRKHWCRTVILCGISALYAGAMPAWIAPAGAQTVVVPATQSPDVTRSDEVARAALERTIAVRLEGVTLKEALRVVCDRAGLAITYSAEALRTAKRVSLVSSKITVRDALAGLLEDTGLEVVPLAPGLLTLRQAGAHELASNASMQQGSGSIAGHVIDGALKSPLPEVTVRIERTTLSTTANADGKYTISGVAPGTYHVTARRVGYQPLAKDVTVTADQKTTLDFALVAAPTRLDEMVTTAAGEQRRYQVGNDISTINADSIAPTAPITSLTDLISARAPGVEVLETGGLTGSGETIRIEGLTSLVLQNDPIIIVDGVRQNNAEGGDLSSYFGAATTHPTPTRLNDVDFTDIQSIDILKGPAASTEYGTDAANGVIVITTKQGTAGAPQWKVSAEQTESAIPVTFPPMYYTWGHTTDGANTPVNCKLNAEGEYGSTAGNCVADSVTQWNPLNNAATSIFGTGNRGKYDVGVSGGSDAVRYYVAGGLTNELGIIRMPPVFREVADTADVGLPGSAFSANSEQQRSLRVNTAIKLGATADLNVTASYLSTYQQTPDAGQLYYGVFFAPAIDKAANEYGYSLLGFTTNYTPLSQLTNLGSQNTDRLTGGLSGNWHPTGWFVGHATVGLDHGSELGQELNYPLANTTYELATPSLDLANTITDIYSVDVRGTATTGIGRSVLSATSVGLQMVDSRIAGQTAVANNITATNLTLNGSTNPTVTQLGTRQATLGGYGEEQVTILDRLFLTGALRIDAASGFGAAYNVATYPKASVSWLAVNSGATTVRVRGAFGESGVQPLNGAALRLFAPKVVYAGGGAVTAEALNWPGNANLAPERTGEFEGGVDVGGWGNRVSLALTGYTKTTHDALVNENLGETLNDYTFQENIGDVQNTGAEASVTATVIENRSVTWSVGVNASYNHNTLLSLGPGVTAQTVYGQQATYRQAPGYPLYGLWSYPVTYRDGNADGIIEPGELTIGDSLEYNGNSMPTQEASVTTHVSLWRGALSFGALVDYRGGFRIANAMAFEEDYIGNSPGTNFPTAPLALQARAIPNNCCAGSVLNNEDGSYVRFRELSVTYAVPRGLLRALRMQSMSVTGAVRNLALWTRYSGPDPEATNTDGGNLQFQPTLNGLQVNNDVRGDFGAVPLARYWVIRLNLGF
jgi:TonB-linked SusC/RagA family outer membrane protein